ncbi:MAG TPA: glycine oxidase ThiO [Pyrinomonadaceae bacterium]|nr:glycine oxidase ThiO [Pyrinomonadaceae bacterium]
MASVNGSAAVVIVGGGVIGLSIARALRRRGVRDVCLVERGGLGAEASSAAGGMLLPQIEADEYDDFFALACRSRDLYPSLAVELRDETGIDIELDTTGTLYLALNEHDYEEIEKRYHWQHSAGLSVELLTSTTARELEPCISEATFGALHFPNDIQVENRRLITALANSVNALGVTIFTETTVEKLIIEGHRITGVQTSRGAISCQTVVVAAGAWSSFLLQSAPNPAMTPVRGQMVCLESKPQLTRHVLFSPRGYLVPRKDGRLLAGSTSENAGFARRVTAGGVASILRHALEISPVISNLAIVDTWAGLRPRSADGLPVLGPCGEIDGLFYATGHYRNGILLAPLTAELISEAIVAGVASPLLAPFSPDRFSSQPVASI